MMKNIKVDNHQFISRLNYANNALFLQKWDQDPSVEFEINSNFPQDESVANSSGQQLENGTKSNQSAIDSMTKTSQDLSQAIDLASAILRYKKSARIASRGDK